MTLIDTNANVYQISTLTNDLLKGHYEKHLFGYKWETLELKPTMNVSIGYHDCLENKSQEKGNWGINNNVLLIGDTSRMAEYLVFKYDVFLFITPRNSRQNFLLDFKEAAKLQMDYEKEQALKHKAAVNSVLYSTLTNKYFAKRKTDN